MRLNGTHSWQISVRSDMMIDCALWIRAAERLAVSADPLVPGPLDLDRPPAPISTADGAIAEQWLGWWHSLIAPGRHTRPASPMIEPAYGTPDPLGLAAYPALAAVVTRRWPQAQEWITARQRARTGRHVPPSLVATRVVADVERTAGRRVRPFVVERVLIPVRDDVIRQVDQERHLVPEHVYEGSGWANWMRDLVARIGL